MRLLTCVENLNFNGKHCSLTTTRYQPRAAGRLLSEGQEMSDGEEKRAHALSARVQTHSHDARRAAVPQTTPLDLPGIQASPVWVFSRRKRNRDLKSHGQPRVHCSQDGGQTLNALPYVRDLQTGAVLARGWRWAAGRCGSDLRFETNTFGGAT